MTRSTVRTRRRYARYLGDLEKNLGVRVAVPPSITFSLYELFGLPKQAVRVVRQAQHDWMMHVYWPSVAVRSTNGRAD